MSPPPRFHVPGAAPGARLALPAQAAHHAREVLRLRSGESVRVFDGKGAEFEAHLDEVSRRSVTARLGAAVAPRGESPLRLVLAVSPLRGDRMELVVQKATELGVVRADGGRGLRAGSFDLVLANLMALLLVDRSAESRSLLAPGGALVLSGLLVEDLPFVREAFAACGTSVERLDGEWGALVYEGAR